jgi:hypothetical protein
MLRSVTIAWIGADLWQTEARARDRSTVPRQSAMASPSIADLFAAQLAELERRHQESEKRLESMISSVRGMISELEALELPTD